MLPAAEVAVFEMGKEVGGGKGVSMKRLASYTQSYLPEKQTRIVIPDQSITHIMLRILLQLVTSYRLLASGSIFWYGYKLTGRLNGMNDKGGSATAAKAAISCYWT